LKIQLEDYKKQNTELQKTIERLSLRAIDKPTTTTTNNTVNNTLNISGSLDFNNIDMEKFSIMMDRQQNVIKLKEDNTIFKKELASMTVI
jgi:hypothetical protein